MKEKVNMSLEDTETVINFSKYHTGDWAEVYTTDKKVMRRYEKFCLSHEEFGKIIKEDMYSMTFSVYSKCASLYPRAPRRTTMTEEQRQQRAEHMRMIRSQSQN